MSDDTDFEARVRARLLDSAEALDGGVRSRLTQARHAALEEHERRAARAFRSPGAWLPAGALAAAAVLAVAVWIATPATAPAPVHAVAAVEDAGGVEDLELLAAGESLDLWAEDPALYEWDGEPVPADRPT